jgi:hypothetical protein
MTAVIHFQYTIANGVTVLASAAAQRQHFAVGEANLVLPKCQAGVQLIGVQSNI